MTNRAIRAQSKRAAQGRAWAAMVLLGLVVVLPAVTVGWLVAEASKNRQLAVAKIYEDARDGYLEAGVSRVLDKYDALRAQFETILRSAPEGQERIAAMKWDSVDGLLCPHDVDGRSRQMAPMEALREVEVSGDAGGEALAAARKRFKELVMNDQIQAAMPASQSLFLLKRLAAWDDDPAVTDALEFARNTVRWLDEWQDPAVSAGDAGLWMGDLFGMRSADGRFVAIIRSGRLAAMIQEWLDALPARAGGRLRLQPARVPAETGQGAGVIALPAPFVRWQVLFQPLHAQDDLANANREIVWLAGIGTFVIAASVALAFLLYRVMQRQARLAQLKNDLVATVSHELKTPIASIRLLVDTLLSDPGCDPQRVREYLGLISRENRRLGHLIENFLSFSRMERDKDNFDLQATSPTEIASEAGRVFKERNPAWNGELLVETQEDLPEILADREALQTALGNLLDNARKYGGEDPWIRLAVRRADDAVEFAVADHGPGIPPEDQKRIFDRFYQARTRLSEHEGGVGLGLSIVSFIVEKHRGSLGVESTPDRGSVFTIRIPAIA